MKTSELTGNALDWAVCQARYPTAPMSATHVWRNTCDGEDAFLIQETSTRWAEGGPIIEREGIYLWRPYGVNGAWSAKLDVWPAERVMHDDKPLIAAMRCYVASKLGDEVDVPEDLN